MRGMTAPECPICATPYEAGAERCAFCGVSLREPEAKTQAQPTTSTETGIAADIAAEVAAETDAPFDIGSSVDPAPQPAISAIDETDGIVELDDLAESVESAESADITETTTIIADDPIADAIEAGDNVESDALADSADAAEATPTTADDPIADAVEAGESAATPQPQAGDDADPAETAEIPVPAAAAAPRTRTPSFARKQTAADTAQRRTRRIEWSVVAALAVLLAAQSVASDFDQLAGNAVTRPWLQRTCALLRCTLPPWREPQALRLLQRDVRARPDRPGVLRISASFRNDARWAQPWPRLRVILSDANGRAIAARDFAAGEYLGATPTASGIASGQVAGVAVDVVDPSPRVTAFTFEFR